MPTNRTLALEFIQEINRHDVEGIGRLMSDDHAFIDAHGNTVEGKVEMCKGWKLYYALFPDYHIDVSTAIENNDLVLLCGEASASYQGLGNTDPARSWRLPAAWKAIVQSNKVKLWQVFADSKIPSDIIRKYSTATEGSGSENVRGFGGVFFKSKNIRELARWYDTHLGTQFGDKDFHVFQWREIPESPVIGQTVFGLFDEETKYFLPGKKPFMVNFRVKSLESVLAKLRKAGLPVDDKVETYEYGKFGWLMDPEGNRIELWEPVGDEA